MDVIDKFRARIREFVGLPADPGDPPDLMRLGLYRAQVVSASSDGATLDVQPDDARIPPMQKVRLRTGIPGAVAVVQPGAIVLVGWERGDPGKPYCVPSWESGATVTKLVVKAAAVYLGDESGAKKLATEDHTHSFTYVPGTSGTATATTDPPSTGLTAATKAT